MEIINRLVNSPGHKAVEKRPYPDEFKKYKERYKDYTPDQLIAEIMKLSEDLAVFENVEKLRRELGVDTAPHSYCRFCDNALLYRETHIWREGDKAVECKYTPCHDHEQAVCCSKKIGCGDFKISSGKRFN